jgi:hypothetical protein
MPGWLRSVGSGPLTWMLSNATSTAWINQTNQKEDKAKIEDRSRTSQRRNEMKIKLTSVYVDDQGKALRPGENR